MKKTWFKWGNFSIKVLNIFKIHVCPLTSAFSFLNQNSNKSKTYLKICLKPELKRLKTFITLRILKLILIFSNKLYKINATFTSILLFKINFFSWNLNPKMKLSLMFWKTLFKSIKNNYHRNLMAHLFYNKLVRILIL